MEKTLSFPHGVRFAPSPTGRFHIGNLRTAWISHEWARFWDEPWVVRFEDIDAPRAVAGAREGQLADLAQLGLKPDQVVIQSGSHLRHWQTFARAVGERRVYPCYCSRKEVREALERAGSAPHFKPQVPPDSASIASASVVPTYSGHCRGLAKLPSPHEHELPSLAWRFAVEEDPSGFSDFIVGRSSVAVDAQGLPTELESFAPAYHWACAVDDWDGNYRLLVRAADLAEVLPQHRAIMRWLGAAENRGDLSTPAVFHTCLVTQNDGHRLEKRTRGATLLEIQAAGHAMDQVLSCFRESWDSSLLRAWEPGKIFGESSSTLTLNTLGLG